MAMQSAAVPTMAILSQEGRVLKTPRDLDLRRPQEGEVSELEEGEEGPKKNAISRSAPRSRLISPAAEITIPLETKPLKSGTPEMEKAGRSRRRWR